MKKGKFPKEILKKKTYCIIAIGVFIAAGAIIFAVSAHTKGARKDKTVASVQSTVVTKGSISNTIDASGNLQAAETIDVTVPTGIKVEKIKVESGEEVTKGQTLATLNKTSVTRLLVDVKDSLEAIDDELDKSGLSSLEKEELSGEKSELEKTEETLTALYKNPVITAPSAGIIGTVNISENAETSAGVSSSGSDSSGNTGQSNNSLSQISAEKTNDSSSKLLFLTSDTQTDASDSSDTEPQLKTITDYSKLSIQTPVAGEAPQKSIPETSMYTGTISWDCSGSVFQGGTVYTATIVLTAKSGCTFSEKNLPIIKDASFNWNIYYSGEGNTLKIVAKYEKTADTQNEQDDSSGQPSPGNSSDSSADQTTTSDTDVGDTGSNNTDTLDNADKTSDTETDTSKNTTNQPDDKSGSTDSNTAGNMTDNKSGSSSGGMSGARSGSASGGSSGAKSGSSSSATTSGSTASGSSSEYSNYETVAFSIAKQDNVKIVVNVDELDILSVEKEQSAIVTLDALENEEYTGTVSKISNTASAGSGSTKYEVEITVPMSENMLIGMSASAAIQVSSSEDTLLLPMTALQQKGDETFVYTQKDKDGNLSGAVTVETGLSNGQNVEILSGLEEGTEVYYTRAASDNSESFNAGGMFPGGMGNMGGNGDMPSRPDGERNHQGSDSSRKNGEKGGNRPSGD